jgi:hypothetical protein
VTKIGREEGGRARYVERTGGGHGGPRCVLGSSLPPAASEIASDARGAVTRAGSCAVGSAPALTPSAVTRAGSLSDALDERIDWYGMDSRCARVLAVMGNRGGWSVDRLVEATGLSVQVVLQTKCLLELQGMGSAFVG